MRKVFLKIVCVSGFCLWAGYTVPRQTQAPVPTTTVEREVEFGMDMPEGPEQPVAAAPQALEAASNASQWGLAALEPGFKPRQISHRPASGFSRVLALLVPGLSLAAPTPLGNMPNFPVQPDSGSSWTLQGLADDQAEGGEGADVVEYGG